MDFSGLFSNYRTFRESPEDLLKKFFFRAVIGLRHDTSAFFVTNPVALVQILKVNCAGGMRELRQKSSPRKFHGKSALRFAAELSRS
jgi:hypothetical protein